MRKQDRIAAQQQSREPQRPDRNLRPVPDQREQMKGSASPEPSKRPERPRGKLPLPD
jgi:hypothetical protein